MPERTKFGIIGCSRIANRSVIPAIRKSENAELGIIGSRSTEKAKETAEKFGLDNAMVYMVRCRSLKKIKNYERNTKTLP